MKGTNRKKTMTCVKCGFLHTVHMTTWGDFDGWSDNELKMDPHRCPFCIHAAKLTSKEENCSNKLDNLIRKEFDKYKQLSEQELANKLIEMSSVLIYKLGTLTAVLSAGLSKEDCLESIDLISKLLQKEALLKFDSLSK